MLPSAIYSSVAERDWRSGGLARNRAARLALGTDVSAEDFVAYLAGPWRTPSRAAGRGVTETRLHRVAVPSARSEHRRESLEQSKENAEQLGMETNQ